MPSKSKNPSLLIYMFALYVGVVVLTLVTVVPKFQTMFNEAGIKPTGMTQLVLSLSEMMRTHSSISFLACLGLVYALNWYELNELDSNAPNGPKLRRAWGIGITLFMIVIEAILVFAVYRPIVY